MKTVIATSRERAVEAERNDGTRIKVFTDGSGYKGQIRAAAVLASTWTIKRPSLQWGPERRLQVLEFVASTRHIMWG